MSEHQFVATERQFVVFDLNAEAYGVDIGAVREIVRIPEITKVSNAPKFIEGLIDFRGKVIPVVNLRARFSLSVGERSEAHRILVADVSGQDIGLVVDGVTEVSRVSEALIEPPPGVTTADYSGCVTGIVKTNDKEILLLDITLAISADEVGQLAAFAKSAEAAA